MADGMRRHFASCALLESWHLEDGRLSLQSRNVDAGYEEGGKDDSTSLAFSAAGETLLGSPLPSSDLFLHEIKAEAGTMDLRVRWAHETHLGAGSNEVLSQREYAVISTTSPGGPLSVIADRGLLSTAMTLLRDVATLRRPAEGACEWEQTPILWSRGTAGVFFHEAIGHPAERSMSSAFFPDWLEVRDMPLHPGLGSLSIDDAGLNARPADLRQEAPWGLRRASYRQPLSRRLTNLVCGGASPDPLKLPQRYIEILAVSGGEFDAIDDRVTLHISASRLVDGTAGIAQAPFRYSAGRREIAGSLQALGSRLIPYPGVLCSDDGQTLPVGTFSPDLLTAALR